ncbi:MAG: tetratricopeptide repeat protein [bacterium]
MKKRYPIVSVIVLCCLFLLSNPQKSHSVSYDKTGGLTGKDIESLDRELIKALDLYYNNEFSSALPIFKRISDKYETPDLLYWIGRTASKTSDYKLAEEKLKKLLSIKPDLHQARLELALVYLNSGKYESARLELELVKAANPPENILNSVDHYTELIEKKTKKLTWALHFIQGYQYDDNITSGPSKSLIEDTWLMPIILTDKQKKLSSNNWLTDFNAEAQYDLGYSGSFLWNGGINIYYSHSFRDSEFHYMDTGIFTGPLWTGSHDFFKMPGGISHKQYGGNSLSDTFHIDPSLEHFFTDQLSLKVNYAYSVEDYNDKKYADAGYDNSNHLISFGPNFFLKDRKHIISGLFSYEDQKADTEEQSYSATHYSISYFTKFKMPYFTKFKTKTELFLYYSFVHKKYEEYDSASILYLLYPNETRQDNKSTIIFAVGQNITERFFSTFEFTYLDNSSNQDLYDFNKMTLTLSGGLKF